MSQPRRGDVFLVEHDRARAGEIRKNRPCLVVSPDEMNERLSTVIVAPMTTGGHAYRFRIPCRFRKRRGFVVLDQLRTVDLSRLSRRVGRLHGATLTRTLAALQDMFAE